MRSLRSALLWIRHACLPFVARTFRGGRLRKYSLLSLGLAVATLVFGLGLAQGTGELARDFRQDVGLEQPYWEVEEQAFVVFAFTAEDEERLQATRARLIAQGWDPDRKLQDWPYPFSNRAHNGMRVLQSALLNDPGDQVDLYARARALEQKVQVSEFADDLFSWRAAEDVERLRAIVDSDLVPQVRRYDSPLGLVGTAKVIGLIGGSVLLVLGLGLAPLLAGATMAQEVHENTLQPLLGTSLTARGLAVGVASGSLTLSALLAAPQAVLVGLCSAAVGMPMVGLGYVVHASAAAVCLSMLAVLLAHGVGKRAAPGLVTIGLTVVLISAGLLGIATATELRQDVGTFVAVFPQMASASLLMLPFVPDVTKALHVHPFLTGRFLLSFTGLLVVAGAAWLALSRRVTGRNVAALRRHEALIVSGTLSVLMLAGVPFGGPDHFFARGGMLLLTLGFLVLPMQLLLMSRVVVGDASTLRQPVAIKALLLEFFGMVGLHAAIALLWLPTPWRLLEASALGVPYIIWGLCVAALIAIRGVARPINLASTAWLSLSWFVAAATFILGCGITVDGPHKSVEDLFVLFEVSPGMGLLHLISLVVIPLTLVHAMLPKPPQAR